MTQYIWQQPNWTSFIWDETILLPLLSSARLKQGKLIQQISNLMDNDRLLAQAIVLQQETIHTASIEGEHYNPESVRSSVHRHLGLDYAGLTQPSSHIEGLVTVLLDATSSPNRPLTKKKLLTWHSSLFPTGHSNLTKIRTGKFRNDTNGPMQVVSGPIGHETVHYQAPDAQLIPNEISNFLTWWTNDSKNINSIIRAGIAHFYFVTIHPFDDGNGRLARVITDLALAQDDQLPERYYSLSQTIEKNKTSYYKILQQSQSGAADLTPWLTWFLQCFSDSLDSSQSLLTNIFAKAKFWHQHHASSLNARQKKVINRLLDAGRGNFQGGLNTRKYLGMATGISRSTAVREIQNLVSKQLLLPNSGKGRNVSYDINWN